MSSEPIDEKAVFNIARRIESRAARADYLQQVCGADADALERVQKLIRVHEEEQSFLELPAAGVQATIDQPPIEKPGTQIGPYKLLQQIGEGGMGVVYMAEQMKPVERRVALKIIKPGMDTRQVIARFEAERQAVAMMDHPNIAKVLEAGATNSGRPYFVMELVHGIPITKYCDEQRLTLKQRLELFLPVCQAVQHAHQKGIIHRDLKPSNVLVAQYDDKPVPKVIDFGVAKAAQKLTDRTMFTEFGQVVGTLEYMSPEQARFNQLDIDTRSDIYSLGVLLYELLTGCTPFDGKRLRAAAFDEMLRIIREEEPPRPSTRLSSADALPSIAANRNVEPARLDRIIRGELDWIVMKSLEKDRNRRYETANGLARDVERYLRDDPVDACPPSAAYRLSKFARRNRAALAIASAIVAGLVLLVAGLAISNRLIAASRNETADALRQKGLALEAAKASAKQAESQRQRAEDNFRRALVSVRDLMMSPGLGEGEWSQLPEPMRKKFRDQAAQFYASLLQTDSTDPSLRYETAVGHRSLGDLYRRTGDYGRAEELIRQSMATLEKVLRESPDNVDYRRQLAWSQFMLFTILRRQERADEADRIARRSMDLYDGLLSDQAQVADDLPEEAMRAHSQICDWLQEIGRSDDAERVFQRLLAIRERQLSPATPTEKVASWDFDLAQLRVQAGRMQDAADLYSRALKAQPDHGWYWYYAAAVFLYAGDVESYRAACRVLLDRAGVAPDNPHTSDGAAKTCALAPASVPDFSRAERLAEHSITGTAGHPAHRYFILTKGLTEYRAGRYRQAIELLERFAPRAGGINYDATGFAVLAMAQHHLGDKEEARASLTAARDISAGKPRNAMGNVDWLHCEILCREAEGLIGAVSPEEVMAAREQRWARELAALSEGVQRHAGSPNALEARAKWLLDHGRFTEAERDYERLLHLYPADYRQWLYRACLLAYLGRQELHREHCRAMLDRFTVDSTDALELHYTTKAALLLPLADANEIQKTQKDIEGLARRAERVHQLQPDRSSAVILMGMAEYRAGRNEEAVRWLERFRQQVGLAESLAGRVAVDSFLALTHHRLGQREEARAALERAARRAKNELPAAENGYLDPVVTSVEDWLFTQTILREAQATILGSAPRAAPEATGPSVPPLPPAPTEPSPFRGEPRAVPGLVEAEDFDEGGQGVAYYDTSYQDTGAQTATPRYRLESVDIDAGPDSGKFSIGGIVAGEWLAYTVEVKETGVYDLHLHLCSPGGGKLHLEFGGKEVTGPVDVPRTGWENWTTVTARGLQLEAGRQVMRVMFDAAAPPQVYICNLNWIEARRAP